MGIEKDFQQEMQPLLQSTAQPRLLIALSGGLDSVVLGHLCKALQSRWPHLHCGIAHTNYQLRAESEEDAHFVEQLAKDWGFDCYMKIARVQGANLQAQARALRYDWFQKLCTKHNYTWVATAHHLDDSLESILLHLLRGTGLPALRGCAPQRGQLIRPLHAQCKEALWSLAKAREWPWREDKSNTEKKYLRNLLRQEVLPALRRKMPRRYAPFRRSLARLRATQAIVEAAQQRFEAQYLHKKADFFCVHLPRDWQKEEYRGLLFATLQGFGLRYTAFEQLCTALKSPTATGKQWKTSTHTLYINRDALHLVPNTVSTAPGPTTVPKGATEACFGTYVLHFRYLKYPPTDILATSSEEAYLNADLLEYPLQLRSIAPADRFQPLGMRHTKKLSDFMIDKKISINLKKKLFLLTSAEKIVWAVNLRIDDRFRLHPDTRNILHVRLCTPVL